ncbi:hypothetical protein SDC9_180769 [bioreactor metagenome]|uniref:Uncharacterized protein n=1 Tax=bioreactor metagenome TaxID=1076179 RepID=A0A645HAZ9_9ZZZZ
MRAHISRDAAFRIIFFDGDADIKVQIIPNIGDPETALPKYPPNEICTRENAAAGKLMRGIDTDVVIKPAVPANTVSFVQFLHTLHADQVRIDHHLRLSSRKSSFSMLLG